MRFGSAAAFSAVGTVALYEDHRGIDDLEESYVDDQAGGVPDKAFNDLQLRYCKLRRTRLGFGGELAYEPSDVHRWYLDAYQTGYTEFQNKNYLVTSFVGNALPVAGTNELSDTVDGFRKHATDHQETLPARLLSLGGRDVLGAGVLDYRASYAEGRYIVTKDYSWNFQIPNAGNSIVYDNITHPNWPRFTLGRGPDPLNPNNYTLADAANGAEHDKDREYSGAVNWAEPLHWLGEDDELKLGVSGRFRDKVLRPHQSSFLNIPAVSLAQFVKPDSLRYYDNHYQIGNAFDLPALEAFYASPGNGLLEDLAADALADAQSDQHNREDVYALYAQYRWRQGPLTLLGGVRLEHTRATYQAYAFNNDTGTLTLNAQSSSYTNAFPTLQARYEIAPRLLARASVSSAIARPGFNQITAAVSLTPSSNAISQGNPALRPTTGYNLDLGVEKYFEGVVLSF